DMRYLLCSGEALILSLGYRMHHLAPNKVQSLGDHSRRIALAYLEPKRCPEEALRRFPDPSCVISAARGDESPIGRPGERKDMAGMSVAGVNRLASGRIPDLDHAGPTFRRSNAITFWRPSHRTAMVGGIAVGEQRRTRHGFPDEHPHKRAGDDA